MAFDDIIRRAILVATRCTSPAASAVAPAVVRERTRYRWSCCVTASEIAVFSAAAVDFLAFFAALRSWRWASVRCKAKIIVGVHQRPGGPGASVTEDDS